MLEPDARDYTVDEPMPEESPAPAESKKPPPFDRFDSGPVSLAIWKNVWRQDGKETVSYRATIEKSYRDKKTDEWSRTKSFSMDDLNHVGNVVESAVQCYGVRRERVAANA